MIAGEQGDDPMNSKFTHRASEALDVEHEMALVGKAQQLAGHFSRRGDPPARSMRARGAIPTRRVSAWTRPPPVHGSERRRRRL